MIENQKGRTIKERILHREKYTVALFEALRKGELKIETDKSFYEQNLVHKLSVYIFTDKIVEEYVHLEISIPINWFHHLLKDLGFEHKVKTITKTKKLEQYIAYPELLNIAKAKEFGYGAVHMRIKDID